MGAATPPHLVLGFSALLASVVAPGHAKETQQPPPGEKWMAHCAQNLKSEGVPETHVRKYCACMGKVGEVAEMLTWSQSELERSYPPAHRMCHEEARKRGS